MRASHARGGLRSSVCFVLSCFRTTAHVSCAHTLSLLEANKHAIHVTAHTPEDGDGHGTGLGGSFGTQAFGPEAFGPGAAIIDTTQPFRVSAYFAEDDGVPGLKAIEITLTGESGREARLTLAGSAYLGALTGAFELGLTPTASYWSSNDLNWLEGGVCAANAQDECGETLTISNFEVHHGQHAPPPPVEPPREHSLSAQLTEGEAMAGSWPLPPPRDASYGSYDGESMSEGGDSKAPPPPSWPPLQSESAVEQEEKARERGADEHGVVEEEQMGQQHTRQHAALTEAAEAAHPFAADLLWVGSCALLVAAALAVYHQRRSEAHGGSSAAGGGGAEDGEQRARPEPRARPRPRTSRSTSGEVSVDVEVEVEPVRERQRASSASGREGGDKRRRARGQANRHMRLPIDDDESAAQTPLD